MALVFGGAAAAAPLGAANCPDAVDAAMTRSWSVDMQGMKAPKSSGAAAIAQHEVRRPV